MSMPVSIHRTHIYDRLSVRLERYRSNTPHPYVADVFELLYSQTYHLSSTCCQFVTHHSFLRNCFYYIWYGNRMKEKTRTFQLLTTTITKQNYNCRKWYGKSQKRKQNKNTTQYVQSIASSTDFNSHKLDLITFGISASRIRLLLTTGNEKKSRPIVILLSRIVDIWPNYDHKSCSVICRLVTLTKTCCAWTKLNRIIWIKSYCMLHWPNVICVAVLILIIIFHSIRL